jgi:hypothetical protein
MNDFILKINDFFKKKQKLATVHAAYPHNTRIGDTLARAYIQSWNCIFFFKICICLILIDWLRPSSNPGIYVERIFIVNVYLIYINRLAEATVLALHFIFWRQLSRDAFYRGNVLDVLEPLFLPVFSPKFFIYYISLFLPGAGCGRVLISISDLFFISTSHRGAGFA